MGSVMNGFSDEQVVNLPFVYRLFIIVTKSDFAQNSVSLYHLIVRDTFDNKEQ